MGSEINNSDDALAVILSEYETLREESLTRMGHRITLLTSNTASAGILLGLALERSSSWLLLLVPLITCLFGLLIAYHNTMIYNIGDYIRQCIEPRINRTHPLAMGWHISGITPRFWSIFGVWHLPMLFTVLVPSMAAILLFFLAPQWEVGTISLLAIDVLLLLYFVIEYLRRVWQRRSYRTEATKEWSNRLREQNLVE